MFLNNITVMLFLAPLTLEVCSSIPVQPVLLISAEACVANTLGGATLLGSPPNLVLGTTLGIGFNTVAAHMGPIMALCTAALLAVYYFLHAGELKPPAPAPTSMRNLAGQIVHPDLLRISLGALFLTVALLILQPYLAARFRFSFTVGMAALGPAVALVLTQRRHARRIAGGVDYGMLFFFMGLFVMVGSLQAAGIFVVLARALLSLFHNPVATSLALLWGAAFASAFVDNVPMAIAIAYVLREMAFLPGAPPARMLLWAALAGLTLGGNLTPIGASPNIVAYGFLERRRLKVGWKRWAILTLPPTLAALGVASGLLWMKIRFGWY